MQLTTDFIVKATHGKLVSNPHSVFSSFATDNRDPSIQGKLFIPLVGDVHDAHRFVPHAVEAGATGVIFHQWQPEWEPLKNRASFIHVTDSLKALQDLARDWRKQLPAKFLALTGSNGKTTTKDFLYQILSQSKKTYASHGSFNNHWGVPFTLLNTTEEHEYCVVEMGMNHSGEIKLLSRIALPDVVTVTNVGRAHMGNFRDGINGVARAKEEIYSSAPMGSLFLFNLDNEWTLKMQQSYRNRPQLTYSSKNKSADVFIRVKNPTAHGYHLEGHIGGISGEAEIKIWGEQNVQNLAAAAALAYGGKVEASLIWQNIANCHTGWGRNQWVNLRSGGSALFDGYNANPDSFSQLLRNIERNWDHSLSYVAIFGEMLELGENTIAEHETLGTLAAQLPWANAVFIGPSAAAFARGWQSQNSKIKPVIFNSYKESLDLDLQSMLNEKTQFIVKGSRGGALERVIERLDPVQFAAK